MYYWRESSKGVQRIAKKAQSHNLGRWGGDGKDLKSSTRNWGGGKVTINNNKGL